jgi:hypothetical protein
MTNPAYNYWASGRFPYMLSADVTLNCITKNVKFVLVHGKANTSPTNISYDRRKNGADSLYHALNSLYPNDNIVILGDFNDDLDQSITAGFTTTSWSAFTTDATNYSPLTLPLSLAGRKSTVAYADMIDHVVVSSEMNTYYMDESANVLNDVTSLVTNYGSTTSDHYPVFTRFRFEQPAGPSIVCPADIEQPNATGTCGAVVNFTVDYVSNCGEGTLVQTQGLPSGSVFPIGTTTNHFIVTDGAGGQTSCTFTVTITDNTPPEIICPANINTVTAAGNCGAVVTYTVQTNDNCTGTTLTQTTGLPSGAVFPAGTTTNTFIVTDAAGNTATCSFTVTVVDGIAPTFTRPSDKTIPFTGACSYNASVSVTGNATNVQDNCTINVAPTFTDEVESCGNTLTIMRTWTLSDNAGNAATPQVQTITVTDNSTPYIILAEKEAKFGEDNYINGSVGVKAYNGEASFKKGTRLLSPHFVRSKNIDVKNGAIVQSKIYSAATDGPNPPFFYFSGNVNGLPNRTISASTAVPVSANYKELKIKKNVTVTITGSLYGKIIIEEGANVTFNTTGGILNIENLEIEGKKNDATHIYFTNCTSVRIKNKVKIKENVQLNVDGPRVIFYLGDLSNDDEKFKVEGGKNSITANVYLLKGKIKVDGDKNGMTTMTGWFISEKIESGGKDITWNKNDCNSIVPESLFTKQTDLPEEDKVSQLDVNVMPNPSTNNFNLHIRSHDKNLVMVRVTDLSGRLMGVYNAVKPGSVLNIGSDLKAGVYFAEVIQGNERKVAKIIKF